jgi:hypothetical protein
MNLGDSSSFKENIMTRKGFALWGVVCAAGFSATIAEDLIQQQLLLPREQTASTQAMDQATLTVLANVVGGACTVQFEPNNLVDFKYVYQKDFGNQKRAVPFRLDCGSATQTQELSFKITDNFNTFNNQDPLSRKLTHFTMIAKDGETSQTQLASYTISPIENSWSMAGYKKQDDPSSTLIFVSNTPTGQKPPILKMGPLEQDRPYYFYKGDSSPVQLPVNTLQGEFLVELAELTPGTTGPLQGSLTLTIDYLSEPSSVEEFESLT